MVVPCLCPYPRAVVASIWAASCCVAGRTLVIHLPPATRYWPRWSLPLSLTYHRPSASLTSHVLPLIPVAFFVPFPAIHISTGPSGTAYSLGPSSVNVGASAGPSIVPVYWPYFVIRMIGCVLCGWSRLPLCITDGPAGSNCLNRLAPPHHRVSYLYANSVYVGPRWSSYLTVIEPSDRSVVARGYWIMSSQMSSSSLSSIVFLLSKKPHPESTAVRYCLRLV